MSRKRRVFSAKQKAKIALAALQERLPKGEIATQYEVHPNQVSLWKKQALDGLEAIFEDGRKQVSQTDDQAQIIDELYQKIGRLQMELDWLKKKSAVPG
jgi:transposase-like protein